MCTLSTVKEEMYKAAKLLETSRVPDYFITFCNAKSHNSYVITAFDTYKVVISIYSETKFQAYLSTHLKVPCGTTLLFMGLQFPHIDKKSKKEDVPIFKGVLMSSVHPVRALCALCRATETAWKKSQNVFLFCILTATRDWTLPRDIS